MTQGLVQGLIATAGILWALLAAVFAATLFSPDVDSPVGARLARMRPPLGSLLGLGVAVLWPVWVGLFVVVLLVATVVHSVAGLVLDTFYRRRP
jgi:hypothetical protein